MALQSLESNPQLSFATRMEDWTSLGQHKRHPEFPVVTRESRRTSRKTTWFPRHRTMKPFPATASQEKSHVRIWRCDWSSDVCSSDLDREAGELCGGASKVPSTVSTSNSSRGTSPETLERERASSCDDGGTTWFFSSCGGIHELRRGIQDASCAGPGKSNLPFELRRKAGDCSRVTAGPIDLI